MNKFSIFIIALLLIGGGSYMFLKNINPDSDSGVCSMDVRQCPDGSFVSRVAPVCEFSPCIQRITENAIGYTVTQNGISVTPLEVVADSRCPASVMCIQAGTVTVRTRIVHEGRTQESLVSLNTASFISGKRIELVSATPNPTPNIPIKPEDYRFEFEVTDVGVAEIGTIKGLMDLGPICPVERVDTPCKPTQEMFDARKIAVYASDRKTLLAILTPNIEGVFSLALAPGNYYIALIKTPSGIERVTGLPKVVSVEKGRTLEIPVSIDTGIR